MAKQKTQIIRDLSEGLMQGVDPAIVLPNSVYLAENLDFHRHLGRAVLRKGTTQIGSQIVSGASCLGLYQFTTSGGGLYPLAVFDDAGSGPTNSDVYLYSGGSWSIVQADLTASTTCHFETYLDTAIIMNGTDGPYTSTDGSSWVTTGGNLDVGNMTQNKYVKEFKNRLYAAGNSTNPDRLYYSSIPSGGAVSWTSGNGYIDIEPEEGAGAVTGLAKVPGYLLIFKERSMKRWDTNSTYPESLISLGAPSQEAIVETRQSVFFFNKRGIYETTGGYPRRISRKVQDVIDVVSAGDYSSVSGWGDGENVYFSLGDLTVDGYSLDNCIVAYNIGSQVWTVYTTPNEMVRWGTRVDSDGDEIIMTGDDNGNVWKFLNGTSDGGSDIPWMIQTQSQEFGSRGRTKELDRIVTYGQNIRSGRLYLRRNEDGDFKSLGSIGKDINVSEVSEIANQLEFRVQGRGQDEIHFIGFEIPELSVNINYGD